MCIVLIETIGMPPTSAYLRLCTRAVLITRDTHRSMSHVAVNTLVYFVVTFDARLSSDVYANSYSFVRGGRVRMLEA